MQIDETNKLNDNQKLNLDDQISSENINLIKKNSTFFNLIYDNNFDGKRIDDAKKTLDSIYYIYDKVKNQNENCGSLASDDHIIMIGTDYHGDRRSFQAGVVSELVTWKKDVISVMDVTDGEILFTGSIEEIKNNLSKIKEKLKEKNENHAEKIKNKLRQIIIKNIASYLQRNIVGFSCTYENENDTLKITHNQSSIEINVKELMNILTDMETDDQQKAGKLYLLFGNSWDKNFGYNGYSYPTIRKFFKQFFDISPQQKIALVHDFDLNSDFDSERESVVLTGDYIDRGDGSCEILCMISNIQKRILEESKFKNKNCFIAISGNHESSFLANMTDYPVSNYKNDCYANRLAKKMIKAGKLVSGHIIESNGNNNGTFYSFSHTFILKTDCYLIMRQIFELEELAENLDKENWLNDRNNKNEFVRAIGWKIESYRKKILELLVNRYKKVLSLNKYQNVLKKIKDSKENIVNLLNKYQKSIFEDKKVLESGRQFYDNLKDTLSDKDFFELRYLAMDALVYPIAASDEEKLDLISTSTETGTIGIESVLRNNNLAFSDFFTQNATPECLKSILAISNEDTEMYAPNCLNWNRFFKGITKDDILPNVKQFVGHDPYKHRLVTFQSKIVETDIRQSAGYNKNISLINKTLINLNDPTQSYTNTFEVTDIFTTQPQVIGLESYTNILNNAELQNQDKDLKYELRTSVEKKRPFLKPILEILIMFVLMAIVFLLALPKILYLVCLGIGICLFLFTIFFSDKNKSAKTEDWKNSPYFRNYDVNFEINDKDFKSQTIPPSMENVTNSIPQIEDIKLQIHVCSALHHKE